MLTLTMDDIAGLWNDEGCHFELRFDPSYYGNAPSWTLDLLLDTTNNYAARDHLGAGFDEATFRWTFYGESADESAEEAHRWLTELAAFGESDN